MTNHHPRAGSRLGVSILAAGTVLILVLAPLALAVTQVLWVRWIAIMALAWWLPGVLLVAHWRLPDLDLPTAAVLALGLGLCWMIAVVLLLHWVPGPIDLWPLILTYEIGAMGLGAALIWRRPVAMQPVSASVWGWVAALLLLSCLLRLPALGYHELHGDEVLVLNIARWAIQGTDNALARHAKGPGEIAVAMVVYRALGTVNEAATRLPFALIGVGSVLATALLGRRLFSPMVGFWAGILLVANGFALGLSRIVQYQPAMLLFTVLAVLFAWEFAQRHEGRWLALVAVFSGFGILLHYEFALLAPALLVLVWAGWKRAPNVRRMLLLVLLAGLAGALIVAAAYLPNILNPLFARTQDYVGDRLGDLGAFNVATFVELGTLYNSTYFFVGLVLLVLAGLVVGWRTARRRTLLLVLWFLPFLILYLFVMSYPGTHFYLLMPSWSLLAALPLAALVHSVRLRPAVRWGLIGLVCLWLAVSVGYLYLAFFQQSPQYVVDYEHARLPFYWAPYGKDVPTKPRYSFPIQEGWKTPGLLADWGCLQGTFATNEGSRSVTRWYLRSLEQVDFEALPDWIFVAADVQSRHLQYYENRLEGYQRVGEVRVRGEPRIEAWARTPLVVPYVTYNSEEFAPIFDQRVPTLVDPADPAPQVQGLALGNTLVLESAGLERTELARGDLLHLLLVWRPVQAVAQDYKVFVHLVGEEGQPVAQWDGFPCLNLGRTSQWPAGEAVRDHVLMRIPDDVAPGSYALLAGLYDEASGERVGDQAVQIGTVTVR